MELKTPISILVIDLIRCWRMVRMATGDNLGGTKTSKVITTRAQIAQNIGSDSTFESLFVPMSDSGARNARDRQSERQTWRQD